MIRLSLLFSCVLMLTIADTAMAQDRARVVLEKGEVRFEPDARGNRVPDFSYCGYAMANRAIPMARVGVVVSPVDGDNTARLQAAIDHVASLAPGENGVRGAVLLRPGRYAIDGALRIGSSGVVLRGSGVDQTTLVATGVDRRTMITVAGKGDLTPRGEPVAITDEYVPVNAMAVTVAEAAGFRVGDRVLIRRPCTQEWIDALGTGDFGGDRHGPKWKPGSRELVWDRTLTAIDGQMLRFDAPITTALEQRFGGGTVVAYDWPGRIREVGIENMRLESAYDAGRPKDEDHAWFAITMENVEDAWVRQVTMAHFSGGAVALWPSASRVTVEDCKSLEPVGEIGGFRRVEFQTAGQLNLFQRCFSEEGWHDFAAGFCAPGPNAFVQCESRASHGFSGGVDSWASGVLYDNVNLDGHALGFVNLSSRAFGAGWSAANSVLWQCNASWLNNHRPPTADNWAIGCWGEFSGDGHWQSSNEAVEPRSLYYAQLAERLGAEAVGRAALIPIEGDSGSAPSLESAAEMTAVAARPALTMADWIDAAAERQPISTDAGDAPDVGALQIAAAREPQPNAKGLTVRNGWLLAGDELLVGKRQDIIWWGGSLHPTDERNAKPAITRYVPGRTGTGLTDDLEQVTDAMLSSGAVALEHNYGLWYERRRDDHERVRRMDADVWAPFYEQPFARSGVGVAWDGLSKYDLTRYNPWYWGRLRKFVDLAEQKGLVLIHEHYFQHNILEAGAHWVDSPWRPANAIQETGFPEPPPFAGGKRIFLAEAFYDVTHSVRRELHRAYIRQCLANFVGQRSVIHTTSAEYTGPLHFVQFWLDVAGQWEAETGENAVLALSAPRDVQDAILADPERARHVDVIDIRYWWYQPDGSAYAPEGGRNLAPRQHARLLKPKAAGAEQVARAVHEYRQRYPQLPVIYSASGREHGWAVLAAGGSLAELPRETDAGLLRAIPQMKPVEAKGAYVIGGRSGDYLVYSPAGSAASIDLGNDAGVFEIRMLDPRSGRVIGAGVTTQGGHRLELSTSSERPLLWLVRQP
jgi:hypothetical protein